MPEENQITNEETQLLMEFYNNGDVEGLAAHLEEVFPNDPRVQSGGEPPRPIHNAIARFFSSLGANKSPKADSFTKALIDVMAARFVDLIADTGEKLEDMTEQVKRGESADMELIADEPKTAGRMSKIMTTYKTPQGRKCKMYSMLQRYMMFNLISSPNIPLFRDDQLSQYSINAIQNAIKKESDKEIFTAVYSGLDRYYEPKTSLGSKETNFSIDPYNDEMHFASVPDAVMKYHQMSDEELATITAQLVKERDALTEYENKCKDLASGSKELLNEFRGMVSEEDKKHPSFDKICTALGSMSQIGSPERFKKLTEELADSLSDFPDRKAAGKVLQDITPKINEVGETLKNGLVETVFKRAGTYSEATSKVVGLDIDRLKAEARYRTIRDNPYAYEKISDLQGKIKDISGKVDGHYSKVINYIEAMRFHYGDDIMFISTLLDSRAHGGPLTCR